MELNEHFENQKHEWESALQVNAPTEQPIQVNPKALERMMAKRQKMLPLEDYVAGILKGDIVILSKAITLVESSLPEHQKMAQDIISACLPYSGNAIRLGITGVPGAGKSTFIEALGMELSRKGHRLAVLAIDPSSQRSKGSILGDKTRMEELSQQRNVYIRPSASAGTLGGVARKTREAIILCEAAGFDTIFVETVGVGQSEIAVYSMVDFFLLILIGGAGDELQGIKRGIMEMADGIAINKCDGSNVERAEAAKVSFKNALALFPPTESGWKPYAVTCSAIEGNGILDVWNMVEDYIRYARENGYLEHLRTQQAKYWMYETINQNLLDGFYKSDSMEGIIARTEQRVLNNEISSFTAAYELLKQYGNLNK